MEDARRMGKGMRRREREMEMGVNGGDSKDSK